MTKYPSLTLEECEELIRCLKMGLAIFAAKGAPLGANEIQLKSMLSALRNDVQSHLSKTPGSGQIVPSTSNLWVELVGSIVVARIRGTPTDALIRDCQNRIVSILSDTVCKKIMYDALELENPSTDIAVAQQSLTSALLDPSMRIAIVVANTKVAYFSRLAFGDANHRVFYNDMSGALAWLESTKPDASLTPFSSQRYTG